MPTELISHGAWLSNREKWPKIFLVVCRTFETLFGDNIGREQQSAHGVMTWAMTTEATTARRMDYDMKRAKHATVGGARHQCGINGG